MNLESPADRLLTRLLSAAAMRHRVIANNVANSSTPGFLRGEVNFEDRLRDALLRGETDLDAYVPTIETDKVTPSGFDGNNVTLESEMNALEENRITYELYAAILASRNEMIRASIETR